MFSPLLHGFSRRLGATARWLLSHRSLVSPVAKQIPPNLSAHAGLREQRHAMSEVSRRAEDTFLAISCQLEKLPDAADSIVRHSERLFKIASGHEAGVATFDSTIALLEEPLAFIDRCQSELNRLISQLEQSARQIEQVISSESSLNRAVAPLTYIRTNFKVESAALPHSVQQMFLALTEDIERLHKQVSQTFGEKFTILRTARDTIGRVEERLKADARVQGTILRERRAGVERALAQLHDDIKRNQAREARLTTVSHAIQKQVGHMVISLQMQDIVTQKLAHISNALDEVQRRHQIGSPPGNDANAAREEAHAFCAVACRLQEAQLAAVIEDLAQAHRTIEEGAQELVRQVSTVKRDYVSSNEFDRVTSVTGGLVQVLLDTIDEVRGMVCKAVATAAEAFLAIRPIGGLASNLTGVMRQLSAQIHLIALNAQVQAAHNCGGTGLEVLALGTARISVETREISERVASGVDTLTVDLTRLVDAFDGLRREGAAKQDLMDHQAKEKELHLHAMRDETLKELNAVSDCVREISELVEGINRRNQIRAVGEVELPVLRSALLAAATCSEGLLKDGDRLMDPRRFSEELRRPYSVASEEAVHRNFFARGSRSAAAGPDTPSSSSVVDIELFSGDPAPDLLSTPDGPPSLRGDTVLVTMPSPPPATGQPQPKEPALGNNVELF